MYINLPVQYTLLVNKPYSKIIPLNATKYSEYIHLQTNQKYWVFFKIVQRFLLQASTSKYYLPKINNFFQYLHLPKNCIAIHNKPKRIILYFSVPPFSTLHDLNAKKRKYQVRNTFTKKIEGFFTSRDGRDQIGESCAGNSRNLAQCRARGLNARKFFSRAYSKSQNPIKLDHLPRGTFELQPTVSVGDKPSLQRADYHNSRNTCVISPCVIRFCANRVAVERLERFYRLAEFETAGTH